MSTLSPDRHHHHTEDLMRTSQVNMAVAQPAKSKPASKAGHNANTKQKSQMHRRSRTGSYHVFLLELTVVVYFTPISTLWVICVFFLCLESIWAMP